MDVAICIEILTETNNQKHTVVWHCRGWHWAGTMTFPKNIKWLWFYVRSSLICFPLYSALVLTFGSYIAFSGVDVSFLALWLWPLDLIYLQLPVCKITRQCVCSDCNISSTSDTTQRLLRSPRGHIHYICCHCAKKDMKLCRTNKYTMYTSNMYKYFKSLYFNNIFIINWWNFETFLRFSYRKFYLYIHVPVYFDTNEWHLLNIYEIRLPLNVQTRRKLRRKKISKCVKNVFFKGKIHVHH